MNVMRTAVVAAHPRGSSNAAPSLTKPTLEAPSAAVPGLDIELHDSLEVLEDLWRRFESVADCTVFQTFDYLATWQRHIGAPESVTPAIVVIKRDGETLAIFPLAVSDSHRTRRLTWLGQDLCDYLAPLLATDFPHVVLAPQFQSLWQETTAAMQRDARFRHDVLDLRKMPATVGAQPNPFLALPVTPNPSGAHLTELYGNWEEFYAEKRSPATRRRDRTKRKRLAENGEIRLVTPTEKDEIARTLEILIRQKSRALARMGVANFFAQPGVREFYYDLALSDACRRFVHLSRLDIGDSPISTNLGFQFRGRYYYVLASYDDGELSRFGPGAAHLRDLMAHAIDLGLREFDFTIGDERYKSEWADIETPLYDYFAAASLRGWPTVFLSRAFTRLKRTIKQTPILWSTFVRARSSWASLRGRNGRH